jgi:hypothetical protein
MMRMRIVVLILFVLLPSGLRAQSPAPDRPASQEILTNSSVLQMTKVGLPADIIVDKISATPCRFDTSTSALLQLKSAGVPDPVVRAMIQCRPAPAPHAEPHVWVGTNDEWVAYDRTLASASSTSTSALIATTGKTTVQRHSEYPDVTRALSEKCHGVVITNDVADADYAVAIERYHSGHLLTQRNRFSIFRTQNGNLVKSDTTTWLRNAANDICEAVLNDAGRKR